MRYVVVCLSCLLAVLAGCGGGSSTDSAIRLKGVVIGGGQPATVTTVSAYRQGHVGEAEYLIASVPGPNRFDLNIPSPRVCDVRILFDYAGVIGPDPLPPVHGEKVIANVQVSAPETDLGTIDLGLPVP